MMNQFDDRPGIQGTNNPLDTGQPMKNTGVRGDTILTPSTAQVGVKVLGRSPSSTGMSLYTRLVVLTPSCRSFYPLYLS